MIENTKNEDLEFRAEMSKVKKTLEYEALANAIVISGAIIFVAVLVSSL